MSGPAPNRWRAKQVVSQSTTAAAPSFVFPWPFPARGLAARRHQQQPLPGRRPKAESAVAAARGAPQRRLILGTHWVGAPIACLSWLGLSWVGQCWPNGIPGCGTFHGSSSSRKWHLPRLVLPTGGQMAKANCSRKEGAANLCGRGESDRKAGMGAEIVVIFWVGECTLDGRDGMEIGNELASQRPLGWG